MQVSSGLPHMLSSNQRGRGQEPVIVLGSMRFAVTVNIGLLPKVVLAANSRENDRYLPRKVNLPEALPSAHNRSSRPR